MNHRDHVHLIEHGIVANSGGVWADLGAGSGAFTLALRELAGPEVEIFAVDRDQCSLQTLREAMDDAFPGTRLHLVETDFTAPLNLAGLDGIVVANALHYVRDQRTFLRSLQSLLSPAGRLIVVEYDTDIGNRWVPYPLSSRAFIVRAAEAGFRSPTVMASRPSRFLGSIYAATALARA